MTCHIIHIIKIRISLEIVCGNLKVPVGTVGPEGLELPQQLLDAKAGPDDDDDDGGGDDGDDDDDGDDGDGDDDDDDDGDDVLIESTTVLTERLSRVPRVCRS